MPGWFYPLLRPVRLRIEPERTDALALAAVGRAPALHWLLAQLYDPPTR